MRLLIFSCKSLNSTKSQFPHVGLLVLSQIAYAMSEQVPVAVFNQCTELLAHPLVLTFFNNILPLFLQILAILYAQLNPTQKNNLCVSARDKI